MKPIDSDDLPGADLARSQEELNMIVGAVDMAKPLACEQAKVLEIDLDRRRITHVISSGRLDRGNRIVEPAGWKLANFRKAPRVLADHDYSIERVIGTGHDLKVVDLPRIGEALVATTQFAEEGAGAVAFQLAVTGLVNTWSVGWIGLKSHRIGEVEDCEACEAAKNVEWGRHFVTQELLEYSLVAIPANPDIVMGLCAAGLVSKAAAAEWNETVGKPAEAEGTEIVVASGTREHDVEHRIEQALRDSVKPTVPRTFERSSEFYKQLSQLRLAESIRAARKRLEANQNCRRRIR